MKKGVTMLVSLQLDDNRKIWLQIIIFCKGTGASSKMVGLVFCLFILCTVIYIYGEGNYKSDQRS